jgi:hypothetical protein
MDKPNKKVLEYYDWHTAVEYLGWSESKASKVWNHVIEDTCDWMNGLPFTISDWELKHDNGKYAKSWPRYWREAVIKIIEKFGEPDTGCLTEGVKTVTFICSW